jgi:hypothetical protein
MILKVYCKETNRYMFFDKIDYVDVVESITHVKEKGKNIGSFMRFKIKKSKHKTILDFKSFVNHIFFNPQQSEKTPFLTKITMFRKNQNSENIIFSGHGFLMNDEGKVIQTFYNFKY